MKINGQKFANAQKTVCFCAFSSKAYVRFQITCEVVS